MPTNDPSPRLPGWLLFTGLVLLALNLRPVTVDVTPVLTEAGDALGLDTVGLGVLTSLPLLCFGLFAAVGPAVIHRLGVHKAALAVIVPVAIGLVGRYNSTTGWIFLTWTAVVMAAIGVGNVLLPAIAKQDFGARAPLATASYTTALAIGLTGGSMSSAPLAHQFGWHAALIPALVASLLAVGVWVGIVLLKRTRTGTPAPQEPARRIRLRELARTRVGRLLGVFFACQAALAFSVMGWLPTLFRDAGVDPIVAGSLLGFVNLIGLGLAFPIPAYLGRHPRALWIVPAIGLSGIVGMTGLIVAPAAAPFLWATTISIGLAGFPVFLSMLGLHSRTPGGTAVLSAFAQSVGFLLAVPLPLLTGLLHSATGSWTVPIAMWMCLLVGMVTTGTLVQRSGYVEDELPATDADTAPDVPLPEPRATELSDPPS